jgi:hypothetical protein
VQVDVGAQPTNEVRDRCIAEFIAMQDELLAEGLAKSQGKGHFKTQMLWVPQQLTGWQGSLDKCIQDEVGHLLRKYV